jgi:hypothetical protein
MKYLHEDAPGIYHLDHMLAPEVSAMFAAMSSRMPKGGIKARYKQIVEAVAEDIYEQRRAEYPTDYLLPWEQMVEDHRTSSLNGDPSPPKGHVWLRWHDEAEDRLCEYPIHPRVQEFFDQFVLNYGHSSILELC